ncbi:hypothetical protein [Deinococcus sp. QL22]|uniref:hypothetical protein n=1 Tax=Deinococcus sp. QL22 TaxID=2939437 RepID=UPI0020180423|nr:hypothetical protein [Deinococcus sp. QL22]UQN10554.1 hypothetical protein M1R55_30600 [Deinococcus sp. QL22]
MNRNSFALLLLLVPSTAFAADLRIYPSFTEVQQPASPTITFPFAQWRWIQPSSFSVSGQTPVAISWQPAELDWLRTQEGKRITWTPSGQAVQATLERADDLLIQLSTGEYINAQRSDLAFSEKPPMQGGVTLRLDNMNTANSSTLLYRTQALFWRPRYELTLNGTVAHLAALAHITNQSDQVFTAGKVDLFGGNVEQQQQNQSSPMPIMTTPGNVSSANAAGGAFALPAIPGNAGLVRSLGEVRGLQRYALPGGLTLGRGESRTLPFLKPQVKDFIRYASVQSYFDTQNRSGQASRQYKFTSSQSLPTGLVDVRESGLLVGSVQLPAVQAGKSVDLNLGTDAELRYQKTVTRTGLEKDAKGQVLSSTYQVLYSFVSTKTTAIQVNVREQLDGRNVSVDGQAIQTGQIVLNRGVNVPAGGKARLTFKLKLMN